MPDCRTAIPWQAAARAVVMQSINPATGSCFQTHVPHGEADVQLRLSAADAAAKRWSTTAFATRRGVLERVAQQLEGRRDALALLIAEEMGKPVVQGRAEVDKCAWACRYFAEHGEAFLTPTPVDVGEASAVVAYQPLGCVLAILPWNFPLWQAFRFLAPALMAGNAVVFKPAESVLGCADAIESILRDAGTPEGLAASLKVDHEAVEAVIRDPRIAAVTLTGSDRAGRAVAAIAGSELKKVVLELGGSDPYVVLEDADLELAVEATVRSRLNNAGQSCIGAKRCIVVEPHVDAFVDRLRAALEGVRAGDPRDENTRLGPMARGDLRDTLHAQVHTCVEAGAKLLLGGAMPDGPGFAYPVTLLRDVTADMPAFREELFGPVFTVCAAKDAPHAIALANASDFGLGAAVFTADVARGREIATRQLEAGSCFVNAAVRSDPRVPFGGVKRSGFGRELSRHGLLEFVNIKTVWSP